MREFLEVVTTIVTSKYYLIVPILILISYLFQGKIISRLVFRSMKKVFHSRHDTVNELIQQSLSENKLEDKYKNYYNSSIKSIMYLFLGCIMFLNIIVSLFTNKVDNVSTNIALVTICIALIEYRDNKDLSTKFYNEIHAIHKSIINEYIEYEGMAIEDIVKEDIVKEHLAENNLQAD